MTKKKQNKSKKTIFFCYEKGLQENSEKNHEITKRRTEGAEKHLAVI